MSEGKIVLYRCPTPTNVLCPCGAVARKLGSLGLEYRVERLPYRRAKRPEIEELTRQRRVPVVVDGDEIIHDSRRIRQYLDWKYGEEARAQATTKPKKKRQPRGLYNVKQWRRRKKQSS